MNALTEYWTPLSNIFNPLFPLAGAQWEPCYVEREESPIPLLTLALQPGRVSRPVLLAGARGTGKTSALIRLARSLGDAYTVIWIDLHSSMDLYHFSILDLLLALGGGAYKVAVQEGLAPDPQPWQDMVAALSTLVGEVRRQPAFSIPADALLADMVCARADPAEPLPLQETSKSQRYSLKLVGEELKQLLAGLVLREMVGRVNAIFADVKIKGGRDTLVIADGLDKIEPALAEEVFDYISVLTGLEGRAIYTIPYGFYKSSGQLREDFEVEELPNISLHPYREPERRHEPGFAILHEVARRRVQAVGHKLEDVIEPEALEALIAASGGVLRGFIKLMRQAMTQAEWRETHQISANDAQWAIGHERRRMQGALSPTDMEYLWNFLKTKTWGDEKKFMTEVHQGNILTYAGKGRIWYTVHPILVPILQEWYEEEREERGQK